MSGSNLEDLIVVKRSGQRVNYNPTKIAIAIKRAFDSVYDSYDEKAVNKIYSKVLDQINKDYENRKTINVEDIQDIIENTLNESKYSQVYIAFSKYRLTRAASREAFSVKQQHKFVKAIEKIGYSKDQNSEKKPNELMENFAKTISKEFASSYLIDNKVVRALEEGTIYLNDLKTYTFGSTSSSNLNLKEIDKKEIEEFFNELINIVIKCKQDQYREHTIMNLDTILEEKVIRKYKELFKENLIDYISLTGLEEYINTNYLLNEIDNLKTLQEYISIKSNEKITNILNDIHNKSIKILKRTLKNNFKRLFEILEVCINTSYEKLILCFDNIDNNTYNLIIESYLEILPRSNKIITNIFLNDNTKITDLIIKNILDEKIIHLILDDDKKVNYFSNGKKVYNNINDQINTSLGRTINSTVTINLSRIALKNNNIKAFLEELDTVIDLAKNALLQRYEVQANKYKESFNKIFDKYLLFDSEKLEEKQKVRKVIRNGAFFIGYTGLVESILLLNNKDTNKFTNDDLKLLLEILNHINLKKEELIKDNKLNFEICEVYDKKILNEFIKIDKSVFGIKKVLNKDFYEPLYVYTNQMSLEDNINIQGIYQEKTSSLTKIIIKDLKPKTILKIINMLKQSTNKYIEITIKNDN